MSRINSLTDTTGFMSPQSADEENGAGAGLCFDDEQAEIEASTDNSPTHTAKGFRPEHVGIVRPMIIHPFPTNNSVTLRGEQWISTGPEAILSRRASPEDC